MPKKRIGSAVPEVVSGRADQCYYEINGLRCKYPGTISSNTSGEGPWYCRYHYECTSKLIGDDIIMASQDWEPKGSAVDEIRAKIAAEARAEIPESVRAMSVNECRAEIKRLLPEIGKRSGGTEWARRIMDRIGNGETWVGMLRAEQCAKEALGESETKDVSQN